MKKITPDAYFMILLFLSIVFYFVFPTLKIIFFPYSLIGMILIVFGITMTLWANYLLLKYDTAIQPYETPNSFVSSGPFKFSRNPIYLGMTLILFGADIILGSLITFIFPIIFIVIIEKEVISFEEKKLEKKFGNEYIDYKKKVRRWI